VRRRRHHHSPLCFVSCAAVKKRNIHVVLFVELRCSKTKDNGNVLQRIIVVILLKL
jgi:hypothetical protein